MRGGGRDGGTERAGGWRDGGGGRRRQGVHHKINPFTVSSGCKVRYEADTSNERAQSSKGRAIKADIKLMELIISAAIKPIQRAALSFGDQPERFINTIKTPPSHVLTMQRCNTEIYNISARLPIILWVRTIASWIKKTTTVYRLRSTARTLFTKETHRRSQRNDMAQ